MLRSWLSDHALLRPCGVAELATGGRIAAIAQLVVRLTRKELCDLAARITAALPHYPEGSAEHTNALINLGTIRWVLARRDFSP